MCSATAQTPRETKPAETAAPAEEPSELIELDSVSATQGGLLGNKYDTGIGWQYI